MNEREREIQKGTEDKKRLLDADRAAYMIAWRDRRIKKLEEERAGYAEERLLLHALLFYALYGSAKKEGKTRVATIKKADVTSLLSAWKCRTESGEGAYTVTFEMQEEKAGK